MCYRVFMRPTVLIVEGHDVLRASLRDWLNIVFTSCCWLEAANGEEAIALARVHAPDLVLMDVGQAQTSGIRVAGQLRAVAPRSRVIIIGVHEGPESRFAAAAAGASGYMILRHITTDLVPLMQRLLCEASAQQCADGRIVS